MILTVATVQLPYPNGPYDQGAFRNVTSISDAIRTKPPGTLQLAGESPLAVSAKSAQWSLSSNGGDGIAEEQQMTSNGPASRPLYDKDQQQHASKSPYPSPEHALPSIAGSFSAKTMDGQKRPSPTQSPPTQNHAENTEQGTERRGLRLSGVHSILNPSHGEDEERRSRRRGAAEFEDNTRTIFTAPTAAAASAGSSLGETSPTSSGPRMVRRILTPISPRLQRATSYGRLTGTIDATERPFLSDVSRMATPERATSISLPPVHSQTSQVPQQSPFVVPVAPTPPLIQPPRRASVSVVGSARPSPSPSYADSYSQSGMSGQTSPAILPVPGAPPGPTPPSSMRLTPSPGLAAVSAVPPGALDNEQGFHGAVVSSGQTYQILTVDTSKGHMQLPVEVQAASRMADEKRKRNAGASARFRARRKEKEREAATKISNLEMELAYAQEDTRYYKAERDYLADIILKYVPQYESHLKNRPPSPRHKRAAHMPRPALNQTMDSPLSTMDAEVYEDERPATRRRTEAYSLPTAAGGPPQHHYPPSTYTPYPPSHAQLTPPQQNANAQYAQGGHGQTPHPPVLSRLPATSELQRQEQAYERGWPPSRPSEQGQ
ncbi:uncharacterized protein PV09_01969 [Verruconis gallopava]|uniref:BZIP domain-containing protein n=1 Tax=Verruconis gallopava TaxID=253628 RepID=A0A0D2AKJ5_9PEZI|nr:uncharacterized protein PV09_01969 [Verruconis gallopava]KIW07085.1 hypothetical protein PV09_01969 [Verruconis gallopava]